MNPLIADLAFSRPGFDLRLAIRTPATGITALIGPSGGGKTTLLRLLAGLERPQAGHIRHGERMWFDSARRIDLAPGRRQLGFLFQQAALFPHLSVAGNIAYGLPSGVDREREVARWLARLQLAGFAARRPDSLSGGQRQRVALARALAPRPSVLLLDEPFSAVDPDLRQSLRLAFLELMREQPTPTLLVTHDLDDVRQLADWVGVVIDGGLRQFGSTAEVFARPVDAEVARILGWPNLLQVDHWEGDVAHGGWGRVRVAARPEEPRAEVIAIRPDGLRLGDALGLEIEITRVIALADDRTLLGRLPDHTAIQIRLDSRTPTPRPGSRTRLGIPHAAIIPLPGRATDAEAAHCNPCSL